MSVALIVFIIVTFCAGLVIGLMEPSDWRALRGKMPEHRL